MANFASEHDSRTPASDVAKANCSPNIPTSTSLFTAASESDLYNNFTAYAPPVTVFGGGLATTEDVRQRNSLVFFLRRVYLCTIVGSICLCALSLIDALAGSVASCIGHLLFAFAVAVTGVIGCRKKEWRYLLVFFIISFILLGFAIARAILAVVFLIADAPGVHDTVQPETVRSNIGVSIVYIVMLLAFAAFWSLTAYWTERATRIILDYYGGDVSDLSSSIIDRSRRNSSVVRSEPRRVMVKGAILGNSTFTNRSTLPFSSGIETSTKQDVAGDAEQYMLVKEGNGDSTLRTSNNNKQSNRTRTVTDATLPDNNETVVIEEILLSPAPQRSHANYA